jgi:serine/threonine-protein kinase RsbW
MNGPAPGVGVRTQTGCADASTVARFRVQLRNWLDGIVDLDAERVSDIVLATDEALTNCVEHAYRDRYTAAVMTLTTTYDRAGATVKVCVTDQGRWIEPDPTAINAIRGRGLILMHALADQCTVKRQTDGTTVCLDFHDCPALDRTACWTS